MATHGGFGAFEDGREEWASYTERLEQYFTANDIKTAEKKHAILLSVCGVATYQVIRNITTPGKQTDHTFEELVQLVQAHRNPPPSVTVQRFTFNTHSQKDGETVLQFVAELRHLSEHCAFHVSLDDMLQDRLVCGVRNIRVQRRLLAELNLTFEICQSAEVAETNARELQMSQKFKVPPLLGYHQSSHSKEPTTSLPCYRCGGKQHSAQDCRFNTAECHHCRKKGHIAKVCHSKNQRGQHQQGPGSSATAKAGRTHHVDKVSPMAEVGNSPYSLYHVQPHHGASRGALSLISEGTYCNLWHSTGESLEVLGSLSVLVEYGEQKSQLELLIIAGSRPSLLGRDWLLAIKLESHDSSQRLAQGPAETRHRLLG